MPVMQKGNSGEWLREAERRIDRLKTCLATGRQESAIAEARELIAASQILYSEIVVEQVQGERDGRPSS